MSITTQAPATEKEMMDALTYGDELLTSIMQNLFKNYLAQGQPLLEAYETTLLAHTRVKEQVHNKRIIDKSGDLEFLQEILENLTQWRDQQCAGSQDMAFKMVEDWIYELSEAHPSPSDSGS